jgi:hypothetical protein
MSSNLLPPPTTVWGPHAWRFLHYISLGYPENPTEEDKNNYRNFFISIKNILPCSLCSHHYEENYNMMPLTYDILSNKELLVRWVIDIHNIVNKSKGKRVIPYEEAILLITSPEQNTVIPVEENSTITSNITSNNNNSYFILLSILCGLIVIAIIYKKK